MLLKLGAKAKKGWIAVLVFVLVIGLYVLIANAWMAGMGRKYRTDITTAAGLDADCILVLGCRVYEDGTPSDMLADRLAAGQALYQAGAAPKILVSGDNGRKGYNEPVSMLRCLQACGIPDEDIFLDYAGFNTYQSARRARDVFGAKKVIVVTQDFHLNRAIFDLRALGIEAYGMAADSHTYAGVAYNYLREIPARCKDFAVAGIFKPLPAYLGDAIDLTGDGTVTHPQ
nr:ElyC/SanA/YdcF family protein [bacterium]